MAKKQQKKKNSKAFNERFRKKETPYPSILVMGFTIVIVCVLLVGYRGMLKKQQTYQESIDSLTDDVEQLQKSNEELKTELANMDTEEFIEKIARERLGMIGEDEILLKESEDGITGRGAAEEKTESDTEETEASEGESEGSEEESEASENSESAESTEAEDSTTAEEDATNAAESTETVEAEEGTSENSVSE